MNYKQVDVSSTQPVVQGVVQPEVQASVQAIEVYPVGVEAANPQIEGQAIRDDFIYFLCCAFTCGNADFPRCFGSRSECTFCCLENSSICMKCVDDPKACCIWQSGGLECVYPRKFYSEYYQLCCFECYASLPPVQGHFKKIHDRPNQTTSNFVAAGDATLCSSFLCCLTSCNCRCPSCFGVYTKNVCLCTEMEATYYKPMCCTPEKRNKDTWCIFFNGHYACVRPYTCCKMIDQCCCCDHRCALPCDEEVPCVFGLCWFCTCCVDWQFVMNCCGTINQLVRAAQVQKGNYNNHYGSNYNNQQVMPLGGATYSNNYNNNSNNNSQFNNSYNSSIPVPHYNYQDVQANLGGSPYGANQGSVYGSASSAPTYGGSSTPHYETVDRSQPQHEHQYKQSEHSAPPEAQLLQAYKV